MVEGLIGRLHAFYAKKQEELRIASGQSVSQFNASITDTISHLEQNYKANKKTSIQTLDEITKYIDQDKELQEEFLKSRPLSRIAQDWSNNFYTNFRYQKATKTGFKKGDIKPRLADFKRNAEIQMVLVEDYIRAVLGKNTPDKVFEDVLRVIITGAGTKAGIKIKNESEEVQKQLKKFMKKELSYLRRFIGGASPFTKSGTIRKTAGGKSGKAGINKKQPFLGQLFTEFGATINEAAMSRVAKSAVYAGMAGVVGRIERSLTGTTNKEEDVSDFTLKLKFKTTGKSYNVGVDVKYSGNIDKAGRVYTRSDSDKQRFVGELKALFSGSDLQKITYLLTNLYFHDQENTLYDHYFNSILNLIGITAGLRTLLPTQSGRLLNFGSISSFESIIKTDQRMFVLLNNKLYLMTQFIEAVFDSMFSGRASGKHKFALIGSFEKVMKSLGSDIGVITDGAPSGSL